MNFTLSVRDHTGRTLLHDTHSVWFASHTFRASEAVPTDEHYFALGDKTGPFLTLPETGHNLTVSIR